MTELTKIRETLNEAGYETDSIVDDLDAAMRDSDFFKETYNKARGAVTQAGYDTDDFLKDLYAALDKLNAIKEHDTVKTLDQVRTILGYRGFSKGSVTDDLLAALNALSKAKDDYDKCYRAVTTTQKPKSAESQLTAIAYALECANYNLTDVPDVLTAVNQALADLKEEADTRAEYANKASDRLRELNSVKKVMHDSGEWCGKESLTEAVAEAIRGLKNARACNDTAISGLETMLQNAGYSTLDQNKERTVSDCLSALIYDYEKLKAEKDKKPMITDQHRIDIINKIDKMLADAGFVATAFGTVTEGVEVALKQLKTAKADATRLDALVARYKDDTKEMTADLDRLKNELNRERHISTALSLNILKAQGKDLP